MSEMVFHQSDNLIYSLTPFTVVIWFLIMNSCIFFFTPVFSHLWWVCIKHIDVTLAGRHSYPHGYHFPRDISRYSGVY